MIRAARTCLGVFSILIAGSSAVACGGDDGDTGNAGGGDSTKKTLTLMFSPVMYSAYDGKHDFRLPVVATNASGKVTYKAADESMVDIAPTADGAMMTMRKAGTTTIIGTASDGSWGESTLVITQADAADYELGRERYNNGVAAFDGGVPPPMGSSTAGGPGVFMPDPESACSFCHRPDGMASGDSTDATMIDVEHTPQQTGGFSDQQLIDIFTKAQKPTGAGSRIVPAFIWSMLHKWNVESNVEKGIVTYLRSLEPKPQGVIDFGGLVRANFDGGVPPMGGTNAGSGP